MKRKAISVVLYSILRVKNGPAAIYRMRYSCLHSPFKERVKAGNLNSKKGKADAGAEPATSRPACKSANHSATRTVIGSEKKLPYKEPRHKKTEIPENS